MLTSPPYFKIKIPPFSLQANVVIAHPLPSKNHSFRSNNSFWFFSSQSCLISAKVTRHPPPHKGHSERSSPSPETNSHVLLLGKPLHVNSAATTENYVLSSGPIWSVHGTVKNTSARYRISSSQIAQLGCNGQGWLPQIMYWELVRRWEMNTE